MDTSSVSCLLFLTLFSYQLLLLQLHYSVSAADDQSWYKRGCQQQIFNCGQFRGLKFPYTNETSYPCAPGWLNCSGAYPILTLASLGYEVKGFPTEETVKVIFQPLTSLKSSKSCEIFNYNISFWNSGAVSFTFTPNITLLKCYEPPPPYNYTMIGFHDCEGYKIYYSRKKGVELLTDLQTPPPHCQIITLPAAPDDARWVTSGSSSSSWDLFSQLASEFTIQFHVSTQCQDCIYKGNRCSLRPSNFSCDVLEDDKADKGITDQPHCPKSFDCGSHKQLTFPYTNTTSTSCGLCMLNCSKSGIKLKLGLVEYDVKNFSGDQTIKVIDKQLQILKSNLSCEIFNFSINLPNTPSIAFTYFPNITLMKCLKPSSYSQDPYPQPDFMLRKHPCNDFVVYSFNPQVPFPPDTTSGPPPFCQFITLPAVDYGSSGGDVFSDLADEFTIRFDVSNQCRNCIEKGQQCPAHKSPVFGCIGEKVVNTTNNSGVKRPTKGIKLTLILGTAILGGILVLCLFLFCIRYRKRWSDVSTYVFARSTSSDPSSILDPEGGNMYFGVPIFSYAELQEATHNFDPSTELGDGGFGTVYLGKLKDGREVAVKRLYERNYKRVTQFQNEIEILTRLRHKNLVSLYGCTSSQSRELLLVYEYIPNGTVADHLHGDRANNGPLTWPNRIHIALETASSLVYLHASEIIHRDVKTNNILLDQNFTVKVADFGLSRLFPTDKTHVSTAPQGTPGYVDPEYHQCYQLTEKSDVYSFGVVLAELISSLPAVDISRHRHEINLANLAVNKIQSGELGDFVDPNLGFGSDPLTERMITSVAEVAFRCLQVDKDMRPSMDEVLETLQEIADYKDEKEGEKLDKVGSGKTAAWVTPSPESEDVILLKNRNESTPDSMTDKWTSGSTTSTSNG